MSEILLTIDDKESKVRLVAEGISFYLERFMYISAEGKEIWIKTTFSDFFNDERWDVINEIINQINIYLKRIFKTNRN